MIAVLHPHPRQIDNAADTLGAAGRHRSAPFAGIHFHHDLLKGRRFFRFHFETRHRRRPLRRGRCHRVHTRQRRVVAGVVARPMPPHVAEADDDHQIEQKQRRSGGYDHN